MSRAATTRSTAAVIEFDGRRISGIPAHRIAHGGMARTYQIPRPFAHLTVLENVALPAMFGAASLDRRRAEAEAWQWLAFTGLTERAEALPGELNLHQRKFLEFARALASRPQVLMLDEVLSGLTPSEIDEAVALIRRIRDQGATIVFVEHVMRAVMALCDRVVIFHRGEVLAEGEPREVMQRPAVVSAYLGQATAPHAPRPPTRRRERQLRCRIRVAYGQATALWDVSLSIGKGELLCVVGPNGAGKSTLINAIAGLHRVSAGRLVLDGQDISRLAPHRFCGQGIALVPEGRRLFTEMTVRENLEIGSYLAAARRERARSLERVCALFPALARSWRSRPVRCRAGSSRWWRSAAR